MNWYVDTTCVNQLLLHDENKVILVLSLTLYECCWLKKTSNNTKMAFLVLYLLIKLKPLTLFSSLVLLLLEIVLLITQLLVNIYLFSHLVDPLTAAITKITQPYACYLFLFYAYVFTTLFVLILLSNFPLGWKRDLLGYKTVTGYRD